MGVLDDPANAGNIRNVAEASGQQRTDAAQFREIDAATVFASSRVESQRWITALADLIADIFADAGSDDRPSDVILRHALRYVDADAALLSMPLDGERMEIRNAAGTGTEGIASHVANPNRRRSAMPVDRTGREDVSAQRTAEQFLRRAYLDLTGIERPKAAARRVKQAVRDSTGLVCSIGIGPSKLVAKVASDA